MASRYVLAAMATTALTTLQTYTRADWEAKTSFDVAVLVLGIVVSGLTALGAVMNGTWHGK